MLDGWVCQKDVLKEMLSIVTSNLIVEGKARCLVYSGGEFRRKWLLFYACVFNSI